MDLPKSQVTSHLSTEEALVQVQDTMLAINDMPQVLEKLLKGVDDGNIRNNHKYLLFRVCSNYCEYIQKV